MNIEDIPCPWCSERFVARSRRASMFERVLSVVYIYPFRCQLCRHRFRALRWGVRYRRADRREYARLPTQIPVTFMWRDREGSGLLTELSIGGATVVTNSQIPVGDAMELRFKATGRDVQVSVDVSLVRSTRAREVGVEFTGLRRDQQERLAGLVRDLLARLKES